MLSSGLPSTSTTTSAAVTLYDYNGRSDKALSFRKGQRIIIVDKTDSGWWTGEAEGKRGMFPGNYVRELPSTGGDGAPSRNSTPPGSLITPTVLPVKGPVFRRTTLSTPSPSITTPSSMSMATPNAASIASASYEQRPFSTDLKVISTVKALFDFTGDGKKKINFKRGETINVLQKLQDEGWWEGELNGQVGLFPSNYVQELAVPPSTEAPKLAAIAPFETVSKKEVEQVLMMALCLYDFKTDDKSKLSFKKGDKVEVLKKASDAWWRGRIGGQVGYIPSSYVQLMDTPPPFVRPTRTLSQGLAQASKSPAELLQGAPLSAPRTMPEMPALHMQPQLVHRASSELSLSAKEDVSGKFVVALFDYAARNDSELSFAKGDRVNLVEDISRNWYKGERNGKVGRLPKNYVRLESPAVTLPSSSPSVPSRPASSHAFNAVSISEYNQQRSNSAREVVKKDENADLERQQMLEKEKATRERAEWAEWEKSELDRLERARQAAAEEEALVRAKQVAMERAEKERADRERAEWEKAERERAERERAEWERVERERAERERSEREREERERLEWEKAERERAEWERAERERAEREKAEWERAERERLEWEKAERERAERERAEREKAEREEAERAERQREQRERAERERAKREMEEKERAEKAERDRLERERAERDERERSERERLEWEKAERDKAERERVEKERVEKERAEREREERAEWERTEKERLDRERQLADPVARMKERRAREEEEARQREREYAELLEQRRREAEARREYEMREETERKRREGEDGDKTKRRLLDQERQRATSGPIPIASTADSPTHGRRASVGRGGPPNRGRALPALPSLPPPSHLPPPPSAPSSLQSPSPSLPAPPSLNWLHRGPAVPTAIPAVVPPLRKVGFPPTAGVDIPSPQAPAPAPVVAATTVAVEQVASPSTSTSPATSSIVPSVEADAAQESSVTGELKGLRAETGAVRRWTIGQRGKDEVMVLDQSPEDEDESQLANTFAELRRLFLDERRERRRMADRLAAVEERLNKLGA